MYLFIFTIFVFGSFLLMLLYVILGCRVDSSDVLIIQVDSDKMKVFWNGSGKFIDLKSEIANTCKYYADYNNLDIEVDTIYVENSEFLYV